jgi:hypothetical protein
VGERIEKTAKDSDLTQRTQRKSTEFTEISGREKAELVGEN